MRPVSTTSSTGPFAIVTSHNEAGRRTRPMFFSRAIEPTRSSLRRAILGTFAGAVLTACGYDSGSRWLSQGASTPICTLGLLRCAPDLERCVDGDQGAHWALADACSSRGLICSTTLEACTLCEPNQRSCDGQTITQCDATGSEQTPLDTCDPSE